LFNRWLVRKLYCQVNKRLQKLKSGRRIYEDVRGIGLLTAKNIYRIILPLVIFTSILIIFATIVPNMHFGTTNVAYSFKPLGTPPSQSPPTPPPANNFSPPPQQQQQFQPAPVTPPPANNFSPPPQQQQQFQPAPSIQPPITKPPIIQPKPAKGPPASLQAKGTINSVIVVPQTKWIATGNWIMTINYGNLTGFLTNMSFFDERGTATHTHEFQNFRPSAINKVIVQAPDNTVIIRGLVDVGTNHKVVWKDVPSNIVIKGGKTISIAVNDKATNSHFASQPILGVVKSFTHCSDIPGPDMIILPSCS
jgi:hypothetical protein